MNNFIIPKEVQVGYQNRYDTYTDKLAFITYVDDIGNLRFEKSWNDWKDDKIPVNKLDNIPTKGFILNKNNGGGWGHYERAEFVRVFDPRGHEFEISIDNLMKIILHNGISKGNSIDGELVYGWDFGKRKISLIPVNCDEYKKHILLQTQLTNMKLINNIKEIVPGFKYKTKANNIYIYLGKLTGIFGIDYTVKKCTLNVFYNETTQTFETHKTFTPITHILDEVDITHILEQYSSSIYNSEYDIPKLNNNNTYEIFHKYRINNIK